MARQTLTPRARDYLAFYEQETRNLTENQFARAYEFGNNFKQNWLRDSPAFREAIHTIDRKRAATKLEQARVKDNAPAMKPPIYEAGMPEAQVKFLESWRGTLDRKRAAAVAGVTVREIRGWQRDDDRFAECCKDVELEFAWQIEDALAQAAHEGKVNAQVRFLEKHSPGWQRQQSHGARKLKAEDSKHEPDSAADRVKSWLVEGEAS